MYTGTRPVEGTRMAIDGRDLARAKAARQPGAGPGSPDAYESRGIRLLSHAIVWVPLAIVVWFAYVSGTWMGGVGGGVLSVVSVVLTAVGIWMWRRMSHRRR